MTRYFIFQDAKSQKFWNIDIEELSFTVRFGRIGTNGTSQTKSFATPEECSKAAEKQISDKLKKGYQETNADDLASAKDEAKRFGFSWDEYDDGKGSNEQLFQRILNYKGLPELKHMTIANWEGGFEGEGCQSVIDWLVEHKDLFGQLETLRMADMEQEECELSWIVQGDYSAFWPAFPQLKHIIIQGSDSLELGEIDSPHLESLTIICGGLPASVIASIAKAKLPKLTKLNLYLGVDDYGFDGGKADIAALLEQADFPNLSYLGLCNTEIAADVTELIVHSKFAAQLETLDISKSVFTDACAQIILDNADKLSGLKLLDLSYHYVSEELQQKLKTLSFRIDLSDPQHYDTERDYYNSPMFTE